MGKKQAANVLGMGKAKAPKVQGKVQPKAKAGATRKIKRFDLLKDLGKPVAGKVEPKAKASSKARPKAKKN